MENCEVKALTAEQAAPILARAGIVDPLGINTAESIAASGNCFAFDDGADAFVFVLRLRSGVLFVDATAAMQAGQALAKGLPLADEIARQANCRSIVFETARPGLVRRAKKMGYRVASINMKKDLA